MPTLHPMVHAGTDETSAVFKAGRELARAAVHWHRASIRGVEHLPQGPALLVGNHGLFGLETPVFFYLVYARTGRVPVGLADKRVFGSAPVRRILEHLGGVPGTRENAVSLLRAGRWVVCYPGGSREVFKAKDHRYRLRWEQAKGFAKVAIEAQVPVVPFAGLGVDDTFLNFGHAPLAQRIFGRYAAPMALGLGPVPLPRALHFRLGAPLLPPPITGEAGALDAFKARVQAEVERLLEFDRHEERQEERHEERHERLEPQPAGVIS